MTVRIPVLAPAPAHACPAARVESAGAIPQSVASARPAGRDRQGGAAPGDLRAALVGFLALLALVLASPARGEATARTAHTTVTLLTERTGLTPGDTLWVGLRFELEPHWHVYWRNPGESGSPPRLDWTLPSGWRAGEIRWPVPQRIRVGPLTNYGYEGSVTLMVPLEPDGTGSGASAGEARIGLRAAWLVCREECIPEQAELARVLPITAVPAALEPEAARDFDAARAAWPPPLPGRALYAVADGRVTLDLERLALPAAGVREAWFAAHDWGPVAPSTPQEWTGTPTGLRLTVPVGDVPPGGTAPLPGVLVVTEDLAGGPVSRGFLVEAQPATSGDGPRALLAAVLLALLGGVILNLMPCVLPVLAIKVAGFAQDAGSRRALAAHGFAYAAGVLASFALLAAVLLVLRAGGAALGWGFQLQSPVVVALLAYLMLLVALNLSGVFPLGYGLTAVGQDLGARRGSAGAFLTGVLAAVVASPCTAPFMGTALGYAATRPAPEAVAVFLALGAGFALPVVALSLWPAGLRRLPRPGAWMPRLQALLAFPMYGAAAWLLWVLAQQVGAGGLAAALTGLLILALAAWLYGQWRSGWRAAGPAAAAAGVVAFGLVAWVPEGPAPAAAAESAWSPARVEALRSEGRPVLVNFTAAWCITCKVNEQVALATPAVRRALEDRGVAYLKGDWTRHDPEITRELARHGRNGVPLYLLYPRGGAAPEVLPQLLTEDLVLAALERL
ncbi:MAG: thioredoxin family protein [Gammaproteobacteria bacterium]|nr:thioredoxin family protein [Gammaproteobacteria bacterium]